MIGVYGKTGFVLYILLAVLLGLPRSSLAIDITKPALSFRSITIADGLSNNIINTIYRDRRGFVWLGTQTGLDRFDGINVTNYPEFAGRTIHAVAETDSVYLWVGTDAGLVKFDRRKEQVEQITLDEKSLEVKVIHVDKKGRLLVGTTRGLFIYKENGFSKVLFDPNALSSTNFLTGIVEGKANTFWLTSQNGLIVYDIVSQKSEIYKNTTEIEGNNTFSCLALGKDRLFLGTTGKGVLSFDLKRKSFSVYPNIGNSHIKSLLYTTGDTLYVGINGGGIKLVDASTGLEIASIEHTKDSKGICSNAVYSLLKDDDMLFVGTYMGGLSYTPASGNIFSVYAYERLLDSRDLNVRAFWIGENGRKVIGTRDGLYYLSETTGMLKHYTHRNSILQSDIILSVNPVEKDYLIGTYGGGMYLLHANNGELTFFKSDSSFRQGSFNGYERDKDGNLWIGSSTGVYVYTPSTGKYKAYNSRNSSLSSNAIFSLRADSKNRMWIGAGGAVFMFEGSTGVFKSDVFPEDIRPYTKSVRYIYEDQNRNLWFCDDKEGAVKVDEHFTKFEHLTADGFLPDNSVMSIVENPTEKGLWFATQRGLIYVKEGEGNPKIFSLYDGIPGYIFNYSVQITGDTIWWGNERGLVYYNSANNKNKITKKGLLPPAITSVSVAGRQLYAGDKLMPSSATFTNEISLSASENNVAFTFSALNFALENTDLYEYCLEGYDNQWVTLMTGNRVSYTELPVGSYVFKVRATSNPDAIKSVRITVVNDLYFRVWIVVACVLVFLVLLYFYSGLLSRYRKMKARMNEKPETVSEVPKEKYRKSKIEEKTAVEISKKLAVSMERDRLYLNPDLKLQDVAAGAVGCSSGELSQVLNAFMNTNFTDFVNQYRVEEFIKKTQDKSASKYTLASLSEECGFSSRTSFFRSFKKLTGMSPAEYLKGHGIPIK